uniref:Ribosomal protein S11 n=1 Tax=Prototheca wickerhamii TaxID=3111 RepID=A0A873HX83_PROWI|nr:ribosomal protein S11 [Prototheca wickerhamii]
MITKNTKISKKFIEKKDGIIHIQTTSNNTIATLTDMQGNTIYFVSAGSLGFKNSRKSTTYASGVVAEDLAMKAYKSGYRNVIVKVKGLGFGKRTAVRSLQKSNLIVTQLQEVTPIVYNGCRPPKKRRT